jgi:hypothetical protein
LPRDWETEHEPANGSFVYVSQPTSTSGGINNNVNMNETKGGSIISGSPEIIFRRDHEEVQMHMRIDRMWQSDKSNLTLSFLFSPMTIFYLQKTIQQSEKSNYLFQKWLIY